MREMNQRQTSFGAGWPGMKPDSARKLSSPTVSVTIREKPVGITEFASMPLVRFASISDQVRKPHQAAWQRRSEPPWA